MAGRPRVKNEVAVIEDPVSFLGFREANLECDGLLRKTCIGSREAGWRELSTTQQESDRT